MGVSKGLDSVKRKALELRLENHSRKGFKERELINYQITARSVKTDNLARYILVPYQDLNQACGELKSF